MSELSNAVAPTFNKTIKRLADSHVDAPDTDDNIIDIANTKLASYGSSVATIAGPGQLITDQAGDNPHVVYYEAGGAPIVVVIKNGVAIAAARELTPPQAQ